MANRYINRRKFFILGTSTLGSVYLSQCAFGQSSFPPLKTQPSVQRSKGGELEIFLDAGFGAVNLAGRQAYLGLAEKSRKLYIKKLAADREPYRCTEIS